MNHPDPHNHYVATPASVIAAGERLMLQQHAMARDWEYPNPDADPIVTYFGPRTTPRQAVPIDWRLVGWIVLLCAAFMAASYNVAA